MKKKSILKSFSILSLISGVIFLFSFIHQQKEIADKVFLNGKIYTVNDDQPWAEAVAIKENKILFVGTSASVKDFIDNETEVIDLKGKMMLPGFVSGHDHLISSNWMKAGVSLFEAKNKEDYLRMIKEYAEQNPDEPIVFGYGWNKDAYGGWPTAKELDSVVSDRPAMIFDFTIHDMWFNTKGLKAGGVTKDTEDTVPGMSYWRRNPDGSPEGVGVEIIWLDAFIKAGAWNPEKMMKESQEILYNKAASCGLTSVINQGLITPNLMNFPLFKEDMRYSFELLDSLDKKGELKLRTFQNYVYKNSNIDVDDFVADAVELKNKYDSDKLRLHGIKIHPEGNWNSNTSLMLENFSNIDSKGVSGVGKDKLMEIHLKSNRKGLDVHVHVDGTATTRYTIDAIEASRAEGNKNRNVLQHYFWTHPDDHQRVLDMKIPVNTTPLFGSDWGGQAKDAYKFMGEYRVNNYYMKYTELPVHEGHNLSVSADIPSSPVNLLDPLFSVEGAVTLQDPQNEESVAFPPSQVPMQVVEAIKAITIYPAWQARMEDKIGSIEVGKYADLVILEDNIFEVGLRDIADIKVEATLMDGQFTYKKSETPDMSHNTKPNVSLPKELGCCEHGQHHHHSK
ncbi:amidohydrolase family protein [Flammeovirga sp. MY04]|uniref:amidohydrolase n=1 Tax=Flammeovirga sp. MY04 TaxID=1191459 RepID=UPI00080622E7|nr:amidohydrolase family protein [Flammeovirga sp. MY04]ANQ52671.1 amidohydrolase family protein [Flammeovirga sp. MY04]